MKSIKSFILLSAITATATANSLEQSLDFGLTIAQGNSDTTLVNLAYKADKNWENKTFSSANYINYGESEGDTTVAQILGDSSFKINLNSDLFTKTRLDYRHDDLADIAYRINFTQTIGKDWINNDQTSFSNEIGLGAISQEASGEGDSDVTLFYGHDWSYQLSETSSLTHDFSIFVPFSDTDQVYTIANLGVKSSLSESLSLQISLQSRYENSPAAGTEHHDFLLVSGVSYSF